MTKKLCLIVLGLLIINLMAVSLISAANFDNIKKVKDTRGLAGYNDIEIENWYGFGKTLWSGTLDYNTENGCSFDCKAIQTITLGERGILIKDIIYERIYEDGSREEVEINSEEIYVNGKKYKKGTELDAGTYKVKLKGSKDPTWVIDWIYKTQGETLYEWAVWGISRENEVAYYDFHENTGSILGDLTGNEKNGTLINTPTWVAGIIDNALSFDDASSEYVNFTDDFSELQGVSNLSIQAWIDIDVANGIDSIVQQASSSPNRVWFLRLNEGKGEFGIYDSGGAEHSVQSTSNISLTGFHNLMGTFNGTGVTLYVDGLYNNSVSFSAETTETGVTETPKIGSVNGGTAQFFDGIIDEVGLWNRTLDANEILARYNSGSAEPYNQTGNIVTLNSPANNFRSSSNIIEFNASAVQNVATLVNMSLFHNATGTWARNLSYPVSNLMIDSSGEKNNGTITNVTLGDIGIGTGQRFGEFDGDDNYINVSSLVESDNQNFSAGAWIFVAEEREGFESNSFLDDRGQNSWSLWLIDGLTPRLSFWNDTDSSGEKNINSNTNIALNEWHHIFFTVNSLGVSDSNWTLYLDGVSVGSILEGGISARGINVLIGKSTTWNSGANMNRSLNGSIDEVLVYNRSLSNAEITTLFNQYTVTSTGVIRDSEPSTTGQVLNMNFDQIIGTNASSAEGIFKQMFTEGNYLWGYEACDSDGDCGFSSENRTIGVDSTSPIITIVSPTISEDYLSNGSSQNLSWIITESNLGSIWFEYNGTNTTIFGVINSTTFPIENNFFNLTLYANDTAGNENSSFINWTYKIFENSRAFNISTFETASEIYTINVTANSSLTAANLIFNGTSNTATQSGNIWSATIDVPNGGNINKSFHWNFTFAGSQIKGDSNIVLINDTNFSICGGDGGSINFFNFTFKNETLGLENVNATISSTFSYWLGGGSVNKTLAFINATENSIYQFCSTPPNKNLNIDYLVNYNNINSQQRTFAESRAVSNSTFERILYLLPSSLGIFTTFRTEDTISNTLSLVNGIITRTLSGSTISIASSLTDSSGIVVFFLNPDATYTGTFSKTGFVTNTFTFVPITDTRTVIMGTSGVTTNGTQISLGTSYQTFPTNSSLLNNTNYLFGFNFTSSDTITLISMNITNENGTQLGFQSNAGQGFISETINTGDNTRIIGKFVIQTSNETIVFSRFWIVGTEFIGDYSLFKQLGLFLDYGFKDFTRLLIVIIVIMGLMIFLTAGQITDTSESQIAVLVILIWIFSLVGWLENPLVVSQTGIAQFSKQYGIAILTTTGAAFFILRRLLIRRI